MRAASGAFSAWRSRAASVKRSPMREVCSGRGRARGPETEAEDYSQPILDGRGGLGLRALPEHRGPARAPEGAGRVGAPRRAALPGDAPVLRALAEARRERRRRGGAADRGGRPDGRPPSARARVARDPLRDRAARHARAHVAVGVPGDPQGARARLGVRLAGLERAARACSRGSGRRSTRSGARPGSRSPTSTCEGASTRTCTASPRRSSSSTSRRSTGACGTTRSSRA